jgi:hypothetical protein
MIRAKRTSRRNGQDPVEPPPSAEPAEQIVAVPVDDTMPTPGRLGQLATAAQTLAEGIEAANQALLSAGELDSGRFWMSLEAAADAVRRAGQELEKVAGELVRTMAISAGSCAVGWGVCPEHGIALTSIIDNRVVCRVLGCRQTPEAPSIRCSEPVAYRVVDAEGAAFLACTGHAVACRRELVGAVITLTADSLEHL